MEYFSAFTGTKTFECFVGIINQSNVTIKPAKIKLIYDVVKRDPTAPKIDLITAD